MYRIQGEAVLLGASCCSPCSLWRGRRCSMPFTRRLPHYFRSAWWAWSCSCCLVGYGRGGAGDDCYPDVCLASIQRSTSTNRCCGMHAEVLTEQDYTCIVDLGGRVFRATERPLCTNV